MGSAAPVDPRLFAEMRWRSIGPFRAGWSTCVEGIPDAPDVFYFGAAVGGADTPALLFKNSGTREFNMVYRREDGNIGWVEPHKS